MSSIFIAISAWREILARTLDGFAVQDNVSPEWLVNPATQRRLKLDCYYPDAGVAVRFIGLTAKGQKRQSDWEILETEQRDQIRAELCTLKGVHLAIIDPMGDPVKQMDGFLRVLARARAQASASAESDREALRRKRQIEAALVQASQLRSRVARRPEQMMVTLAEGWQDRETTLITSLEEHDDALQAAQPTTADTGLSCSDYTCGLRVRHARFGAGVIIALAGAGDDATVSIEFDNGDSRTFLATLLHDKLFTEEGGSRK